MTDTEGFVEARARAKWVRVAPRKMRLVADMVRGVPVQTAVNRLHFTAKRAALPIEKAVRSALANLLAREEAAKLDPAAVFIKELRVDPGPMWKRWMPRAMGRATRILKRTSHLTVVVSAPRSALKLKPEGVRAAQRASTKPARAAKDAKDSGDKKEV